MQWGQRIGFLMIGLVLGIGLSWVLFGQDTDGFQLGGLQSSKSPAQEETRTPEAQPTPSKSRRETSEVSAKPLVSAPSDVSNAPIETLVERVLKMDLDIPPAKTGEGSMRIECVSDEGTPLEGVTVTINNAEYIGSSVRQPAGADYAGRPSPEDVLKAALRNELHQSGKTLVQISDAEGVVTFTGLSETTEYEHRAYKAGWVFETGLKNESYRSSYTRTKAGEVYEAVGKQVVIVPYTCLDPDGSENTSHYIYQRTENGTSDGTISGRSKGQIALMPGDYQLYAKSGDELKSKVHEFSVTLGQEATPLVFQLDKPEGLILNLRASAELGAFPHLTISLLKDGTASTSDAEVKLSTIRVHAQAGAKQRVVVHREGGGQATPLEPGRYLLAAMPTSLSGEYPSLLRTFVDYQGGGQELELQVEAPPVDYAVLIKAVNEEGELNPLTKAYFLSDKVKWNAHYFRCDIQQRPDGATWLLMSEALRQLAKNDPDTVGGLRTMHIRSDRGIATFTFRPGVDREVRVSFEQTHSVIVHFRGVEEVHVARLAVTLFQGEERIIGTRNRKGDRSQYGSRTIQRSRDGAEPDRNTSIVTRVPPGKYAVAVCFTSLDVSPVISFGSQYVIHSQEIIIGAEHIEITVDAPKLYRLTVRDPRGSQSQQVSMRQEVVSINGNSLDSIGGYNKLDTDLKAVFPMVPQGEYILRKEGSETETRVTVNGDTECFLNP